MQVYQEPSFKYDLEIEIAKEDYFTQEIWTQTNA